MAWYQQQISLPAKPRGYHLITDEVVGQLDDLRRIDIGLMHVFINHTSASLTLNENASPDVRGDFERFFRRLVPDGADYFRHTAEGPDDMPAHIKASLLGFSVTLPIRAGRPVLGTWQGLYLCEHRDGSRSRTLTVTLQGETR